MHPLLFEFCPDGYFNLISPIARLRARIYAHNNLVVVASKAFLTGIEQTMIGVVWQPFVLSLGASMATLGLLTSLGGLGGLIPTLVSPLGGWLADQRGRKVLILGASFAAICAYLLYIVAGNTGALVVVFVGVILLGISTIALPANNALVGESVRAGRRGSAYSLLVLAGIAPGIFAPLIAGVLAEKFGYPIIFPIALAAEIIAFVVVARWLNEPKRSERATIEWHALIQLFQRAWIPPTHLRPFFFAVAVDLFAWGMGWGLLYGLLTKTYDFSPAQLGVLSSITSITWALTTIPIGRLIDRIGTKLVLVASEALGPPVLLIWMTQSSFQAFALSMPLFALTASLWVPARNTFISHAVDANNRAEIFGRLSAFSGLVAFPSTFLGGYLYDQFGFVAPIFGNLIGSILALVILIFYVREPQMHSGSLVPVPELS